jgi:hypothetical protein
MMMLMMLLRVVVYDDENKQLDICSATLVGVEIPKSQIKEPRMSVYQSKSHVQIHSNISSNIANLL